MKKLNILKIATYGFVLSLLAVSCIPESDVEPTGTAGKTYFKLTPADWNIIAVDAITTPQKAVLFEVRKDAHSSKALNTPSTVTLTLDIAGTMIDAYNTANGTDAELLPASLYTTNYTAAADGKITLNFAAGDHTKALWITIPDATQFDFSKTYFLAYKVEVSGEGELGATATDTMYCQVLAKNEFDGVYASIGWFEHPANGEDFQFDDTYDRYWNFSNPDVAADDGAKECATSGATTITTWAGDVGYTINLTVLATTRDLYAGTDSAGTYNDVQIVLPGRTFTTYDTEPAGGHSPAAYPEGRPYNYYDPATQTFVLRYDYYTGTGAHRHLYEKLVYIGAR